MQAEVNRAFRYAAMNDQHNVMWCLIDSGRLHIHHWLPEDASGWVPLTYAVAVRSYEMVAKIIELIKADPVERYSYLNYDIACSVAEGPGLEMIALLLYKERKNVLRDATRGFYQREDGSF